MAEIKADLKQMKGISAKDQAMLAEAETLLGPDPDEMGFVQNMFWGRLREELVFPYPVSDADETARCDQLIAALDEYLRTEHPSIQIDQEQEIPEWVLRKLFDLGVMGMTIPRELGGLGMGVTSYVRALEKLGEYCGSTAVLVSAHQSIGCKAIMLFGNEEQKQRWLPHLAKDWVSAFCLSEPNVGCDAGGQETRCELSEDGEYYILNGEKKWATSGALSNIFTVMAKQKMADGKDRVTALVCTPDMEGVDIFQRNRSKCGIRGTWQARIRFKDVRVPKANLLHQEGKGLNVALTCLNYGRCTLSAGMLGGAHRAMDQSIKWSRTRYQFKRPLADFELVRSRIAHMSALCYAMDAMLYMTTGFLDRKDEDIRIETAICKVFCSEMGWRVVNDAVQIMGGESYMTENEVERIFRDSRINLIVEGANEVMQSFIFGYGGKALAEQMVGIQQRLLWDKDQGFGANASRIMKNSFDMGTMSRAIPLGLELFLGLKGSPSRVTRLHSSLSGWGDKVARLFREQSHKFKVASLKNKELILERQCVQARLADAAVYLHGMVCVLSKLDKQIRAGEEGLEFERDKAAAIHYLEMAERWVKASWHTLDTNADESMRTAADAAIALNDTMPNELFIVAEKSPVAAGTGRKPNQSAIKQFGSGSVAESRAMHNN
ncbi:MAG: acyl-CoA dehydrogenase family protein [Phycisphaerales bacterium]|nr:acyl-CoA dehydrogenase family protein [Phycisphaerales bacterium]